MRRDLELMPDAGFPNKARCSVQRVKRASVLETERPERSIFSAVSSEGGEGVSEASTNLWEA